MNELDDWQLLEDYANSNSEEAFKILVNRYAGMVYHTALRSVGNPHTAQDATQAVFIALAQKAGRLGRRTVLSGWLFRATRFAVANQIREELRRERREQEAQMLESTLPANEAESVWEQISPHLDEALEKLSIKDRQVVLVRFFENKSHLEVAQALGISEDAAKMRVSRALGKLRLILARRGFVVPSAVLFAALSTCVAQVAPPGLTASVASAALAKGTADSTVNLTLANGILKLMAWSKLKTALLMGIGFLAGATVLIISSRNQPRLAGALNAGGPTVPAASNLNQPTPVQTLRFLAEMLKSGDAQKVAKAVQLDGRTDTQAEDAVVDLVRGDVAFKRALAARFGAESLTEALERWSLLKVPTDGLDQAKEHIDGNTATVRLPGRGPLHFAMIDGSWRLTISTGNGPKAITQFHLAGKTMLQAADELDSGRYASAEEAFRVVQSRLLAGALINAVTQ